MLNKVKVLKWMGFTGAILSGIALSANGQPQEGIGVIFAAFSSANLLSEG